MLIKKNFLTKIYFKIKLGVIEKYQRVNLQHENSKNLASIKII